MKRTLILVFVLAAVVYGGDFLWLQVLALRKQPQFGNVTLQTYYTVKLKNGKTEYDYGGPQDVECAHSLFPHYGDQPCWYVGRKTEQQIDIDSGDPNNPKLF